MIAKLLYYLAHNCGKIRAVPLKRLCYTRTYEDDYKDQIHDETARQSRSALGIGLIIFGF